jgi:hypothetical protein
MDFFLTAVATFAGMGIGGIFVWIFVKDRLAEDIERDN